MASPVSNNSQTALGSTTGSLLNAGSFSSTTAEKPQGDDQPASSPLLRRPGLDTSFRSTASFAMNPSMAGSFTRLGAPSPLAARASPGGSGDFVELKKKYTLLSDEHRVVKKKLDDTLAELKLYQRQEFDLLLCAHKEDRARSSLTGEYRLRFLEIIHAHEKVIAVHEAEEELRAKEVRPVKQKVAQLNFEVKVNRALQTKKLVEKQKSVVLGMNEDLKKLDASKKAAEAKAKTLEQKAEQLVLDLSSAKEQNKKLVAANQELESRRLERRKSAGKLGDAGQSHVQSSGEMADLRHEYEREKVLLEGKLNQLRDEKDEMETEHSEATRALKKQIKQLAETVERLQTDGSSSVQDRLLQQQKNLGDLTDQLEDAELANTKLSSALEESKARLDEREAELKKIRRELGDFRKKAAMSVDEEEDLLSYLKQEMLSSVTRILRADATERAVGKRAGGAASSPSPNIKVTPPPGALSHFVADFHQSLRNAKEDLVRAVTATVEDEQRRSVAGIIERHQRAEQTMADEQSAVVENARTLERKVLTRKFSLEIEDYKMQLYHKETDIEQERRKSARTVMEVEERCRKQLVELQRNLDLRLLQEQGEVAVLTQELERVKALAASTDGLERVNREARVRLKQLENDHSDGLSSVEQYKTANAALHQQTEALRSDIQRKNAELAAQRSAQVGELERFRREADARLMQLNEEKVAVQEQLTTMQTRIAVHELREQELGAELEGVVEAMRPIVEGPLAPVAWSSLVGPAVGALQRAILRHQSHQPHPSHLDSPTSAPSPIRPPGAGHLEQSSPKIASPLGLRGTSALNVSVGSGVFLGDVHPVLVYYLNVTADFEAHGRQLIVGMADQFMRLARQANANCLDTLIDWEHDMARHEKRLKARFREELEQLESTYGDMAAGMQQAVLHAYRDKLGIVSRSHDRSLSPFRGGGGVSALATASQAGVRGGLGRAQSPSPTSYNELVDIATLISDTSDMLSKLQGSSP